MRRPIAATVAIAAATVGISFAGITTAEAHATCIERDWGAVCVSTDHHGVAVADWECDDHEVRVTLEFTNGTSTSLSDPDGCGDANGADAYARTIKRYRLCGSGIACTAWKTP